MENDGFLFDNATWDQLRDLFENTPMGVAIMHHENDGENSVTARRVFANKPFATLFGASSLSELMRYPVHESWVDNLALQRVNRALASQTRIVGIEAERIRLDGSLFWVSMTSQPIVLGDEELTIVWHLDITERKQAERDLKDREVQLQDFIESSVDWSWEMDSDLRFTFMSSNVERITGVPADWHYGKTREDLLGKNYDRTIWAQHLKTLKARKPYRDFVYLRTGDGIEDKWISSSGKPIFTEDGEFKGYRGTGTDISERVMNQELVRSNRDLEQFAYAASHDLKSPLRAISNLACWIQDDLADVLTEESRTHFALMRSRIERSQAMMDGLLQYSRIGQATEDVQFVDANLLIREILELVNIPPHFTVVVAPDMPRFLAARTPLSHVIQNLITNAVKHHDRITGRIEIDCQELGSHFRFTVEDDGPGIPEEFHDRIFDLFETIQPRDVVEGSGMGLAIVKRYVTANGGAIKLKSDPAQRGAAFSFSWQKSNALNWNSS